MEIPKAAGFHSVAVYSKIFAGVQQSKHTFINVSFVYKKSNY